MSRILVVGINYAPESIGTGKYTAEFCTWLAARGHAVRVVTAPPYYPAWRVPRLHRTRWFRRERRQGVEVIRCPLWVPRQPRGLARLLHLGSFAVTSLLALAACLRWRPDVVINIAPTLASAPGAWLLARATGARSWLHVQDFEVEAAMGLGLVAAGPLRRLALAAEGLLLRRFDVVSSISRRMLERVGARGVLPERIAFFPNWADIDGIRPLEAPSPYRAELGIPARAVVALYSGNMGLKQGLELLGQAARLLADEPNLYFVFGGDGPARAALEAACAGLDNVRFTGLQPAERLNDWLGLADIHLLPQRADVADLVMPSKLTGMLASGRPVLATAHPGTGLADAIAGCGHLTAPGDTDAFADALRSLAGDHGLRLRLGRAARTQAEATLARDGILDRIEARIARVTGTSLPPRAPVAARSPHTSEIDA